MKDSWIFSYQDSSFCNMGGSKTMYMNTERGLACLQSRAIKESNSTLVLYYIYICHNFMVNPLLWPICMFSLYTFAVFGPWPPVTSSPLSMTYMYIVVPLLSSLLDPCDLPHPVYDLHVYNCTFVVFLPVPPAIWPHSL